MKNTESKAPHLIRVIHQDGRNLPEDALNYICTSLQKLGLSDEQMQATLQLSEETIRMLQKNAAPDVPLYIRIRKLMGEVSVTLTMKGEEFDPYDISPEVSEYIQDAGDAENPEKPVSEDSVRSVLLRSHGECFKYRHISRYNRVRILTDVARRSMNNAAFIAIGIGLLFGLLIKYAFPSVITGGICHYILDPFQTMFMNALNIIIAPVVFFSITTCISQFGSLKELGKVGGKVIGMYLLTTAIAVTLGIGLTLLIAPGEFGFALSGGVETVSVAVDTNVDTSLLHTIINIVPSNLLQPFLESNTLQIIFISVLCGFAVGMIGQYSSMVKELFEAFNSLFLTITTMITKLIPIAVFCSVTLMIVNTGRSSLLSVAGAGGVQALAVACMLCVYGLLVFLLAKQNPFTFFRKAKEGMITSFSLSSSAAAMPTNMRVCTEKLGIDPRVSSFSIPLGATINMDGTCMYLSVLGLFLARAYGVEVTAAQIGSVAATIILLSLGAPGVPGAAFVCLGIVLKIMNVPVEAISLILAISPILDMLDTMNNTTGDMATALIVAKSENLLDKTILNSR